MDDILSRLSKHLFKSLHLMDSEANTPSGYVNHAGLADYSAYQRLCGKKYGKREYENCWNDRLAELLTNTKTIVSRELRYPTSKKKCDLVITINNGVKIWIEVKSAWKRWFSSSKGTLEKNSSNYHSYLFGNGKTHSVAQDIEKLNRINHKFADYVGLLIIGFDIQDDPLNPDIEQLIEKTGLKETGWEVFGPEIWPDINYSGCCYNCWFFGKKTSPI